MPSSPSAADDTVFDNYFCSSFPARVPLSLRLLPKKSDLQRQLCLWSLRVDLRKREPFLVLLTRVEKHWPLLRFSVRQRRLLKQPSGNDQRVGAMVSPRLGGS